MGMARPRPGTDSLRTYRAKRDFDVTSEPSGASRTKTTKPATKKPTKKPGALRFVVQKHDASRLHYDFRLEHDGVLWSWAVPKGPSLDPSIKRLAARTEDHPLDYRTFEGVIPEGQYGAGAVIVWDEGTWTGEDDTAKDPAAAITKGHLKFTLKGKKLNGGFHLVRLKKKESEKESWLLFKRGDATSSERDITKDAPMSARTGKTLEEVAKHPSKVWRSNRSDAAKPKRRAKAAPVSSEDSIESTLAGLNVGVKLTNLDKVLYPDVGITKGQLIAYYASVAAPMLRAIAGRPLSLLRCPDGIGTKGFFQKHANATTQEAIHRKPITEGGKPTNAMYVDDARGLIALGQMGVLEVHTWMTHLDHLEKPDQLTIDLDPAEGVGIERVIETAVVIRERLSALGLKSFAKITGGKGVHVVAPLTPHHDWDTHKAFALALVQRLADEDPDHLVINARKAVRKGKIFLDYLRNGRGATAIACFSPRARAGAPVALPVTWKELESGIDPAGFSLGEAVSRIEGRDPWAGYEATKQRLTKKMIGSV
jgi:bifunctional non-homologous end joining protein LigD